MGMGGDTPVTHPDAMTPAQNAAAWHGLATNKSLPLPDRLAFALQALDWYETDRETAQPVVERAVAWRALHDGECRPDRCGHLTCALVDAVDAHLAASP